ncbi:MAG: DUF4215 domain-containing protein [Myxococcales bacterium]|nr:DUF4215 domain-containing protein [Myxococcales bacterium]
MTANGNVLEGLIPRQPDGSVVQYKVVFDLDGSEQTLPRNLADPLYEFYVGNVTRLYCTSFEQDPFAEGWSVGSDSGKNDWEWGPAGLLAEGDDPSGAFTGALVLGNDLGLAEVDGRYPPNVRSWARSPIVDVAGFAEVRLQYRRWLSVEDGIFDVASVRAFDAKLWSNFASDDFSLGATHHLDGEWRFQDLELTDHVQNGRVQVSFELSSDGGLEFGGWTIDEVCVVGVNNGVCGDGILDPLLDEECDDGNLADGDGCDRFCQREPPRPPPTTTTTGDDDDDDDDDTDTDTDTVGSDLADRGCGCAADDEPGRGLGGGALALLGLLLARRRRR